MGLCTVRCILSLSESILSRDLNKDVLQRQGAVLKFRDLAGLQHLGNGLVDAGQQALRVALGNRNAIGISLTQVNGRNRQVTVAGNKLECNRTIENIQKSSEPDTSIEENLA